jgi:hypothetical protein
MAKRKSIQPRSRGARFKKLRALRCYREVYARLCDGWTIAETARFIHDERAEYKEISRTGLEGILTDFRSEQIPAGDLVRKRFPEVYDAAKEKMDKGIDEVTELEELYRIQMHRISTDFATEKKIGKLLPSMTSEIKEARQLLESIANLKMEMGLSSRAPHKHEHAVAVGVEVDGIPDEGPAGQFASTAVKEVLGNPESRHRVQGVVERFLKLKAPEKDKDEDKAATEVAAEG